MSLRTLAGVAFAELQSRLRPPLMSAGKPVAFADLSDLKGQLARAVAEGGDVAELLGAAVQDVPGRSFPRMPAHVRDDVSQLDQFGEKATVHAVVLGEQPALVVDSGAGTGRTFHVWSEQIDPDPNISAGLALGEVKGSTTPELQWWDK